MSHRHRPAADHAPRRRGGRNRGAVRGGESGRGVRCGGSLIRHASPNAIGALPVTVIESPLGTALMPVSGCPHGPAAAKRSARRGAVGVATVAGRADREEPAAPGDRFAGGAGRPRRRSAQGRLRLDSAPNPWHNSRDWLGLSELETVTRAPDGTPGPSPHALSPSRTLPERAVPRQRRGCGR